MEKNNLSLRLGVSVAVFFPGRFNTVGLPYEDFVFIPGEEKNDTC